MDRRPPCPHNDAALLEECRHYGYWPNGFWTIFINRIAKPDANFLAGDCCAVPGARIAQPAGHLFPAWQRGSGHHCRSDGSVSGHAGLSAFAANGSGYFADIMAGIDLWRHGAVRDLAPANTSSSTAPQQTPAFHQLRAFIQRRCVGIMPVSNMPVDDMPVDDMPVDDIWRCMHAFGMALHGEWW